MYQPEQDEGTRAWDPQGPRIGALEIFAPVIVCSQTRGISRLAHRAHPEVVALVKAGAAGA